MLHPATALSITRVAQEFARWRAVPRDKRSEMPAWWWGSALALRDEDTRMPHDLAAAFGLAKDATYREAARMILASLGAQKHRPWPEDFPERYNANAEDPAPSAEPAAQAASAAVVPIA